VLPNGKRGVLPSGKVGVYNTAHECPECCPYEHLDWIFYDSGMIDGGQDGAYRVYSNPESVPKSPWVQLANGFTLYMRWEDDWNCCEHNPYYQYAGAQCFFEVRNTLWLTMKWGGMAEKEDPNYELMDLYLDGTRVAFAHAPGGGQGCEGGMGPIVSDPAPPVERILYPETHRLTIDLTTNDERFHFEPAGYWFEFGLEPL